MKTLLDFLKEGAEEGRLPLKTFDVLVGWGVDGGDAFVFVTNLGAICDWDGNTVYYICHLPEGIFIKPEVDLYNQWIRIIRFDYES